MNDVGFFTDYGSTALLLGLAALRVSVAFIVMPLFSKDSIPPLIRNAMYLSLALISVVVQPSFNLDDIPTALWVSLFAKEAVIGIVIGVFFGLFLWAFEAAGTVIDTQIGATFALFFDPIIGNEVTPTGSLLGRWANYLFVASGGLLLLTGVLLESFAIYPLLEPVSGLRAASVTLFENELSGFMSLTIRIAGPVMLVIFIIDMAMGLINRYAQQFNVFFLSLSLKSMATILMMVILMPYLIEVLADELSTRSASIEAMLNAVLPR